MKLFSIFILTILVGRVAPESIHSEYVPTKQLSEQITTEVIMSKTYQGKQYTANQKINNLIFLKEVMPNTQPSGKKSRKALWECYCGKEFKALIGNVKRGTTNSCGCYHKKQTSNAKTTHGLSKHPLYGTLNGMKQRCTNKNRKAYKRYGGRGITVCDEWANDYEEFIWWGIANGWEETLQIDRIDNDGNYEPSNCRFVDYVVNNQNK